MPFKSKRQHRWIRAAESRGAITKGTAKEWADATKKTEGGFQALPERVTQKAAQNVDGSAAARGSSSRTALRPPTVRPPAAQGQAKTAQVQPAPHVLILPDQTRIDLLGLGQYKAADMSTMPTFPQTNMMFQGLQQQLQPAGPTQQQHAQLNGFMDVPEQGGPVPGSSLLPQDPKATAVPGLAGQNASNPIKDGRLNVLTGDAQVGSGPGMIQMASDRKYRAPTLLDTALWGELEKQAAGGLLGAMFRAKPKVPGGVLPRAVTAQGQSLDSALAKLKVRDAVTARGPTAAERRVYTQDQGRVDGLAKAKADAVAKAAAPTPAEVKAKAYAQANAKSEAEVAARVQSQSQDWAQRRAAGQAKATVKAPAPTPVAATAPASATVSQPTATYTPGQATTYVPPPPPPGPGLGQRAKDSTGQAWDWAKAHPKTTAGTVVASTTLASAGSGGPGARQTVDRTTAKPGTKPAVVGSTAEPFTVVPRRPAMGGLSPTPDPAFTTGGLGGKPATKAEHLSELKRTSDPGFMANLMQSLQQHPHYQHILGGLLGLGAGGLGDYLLNSDEDKKERSGFSSMLPWLIGGGAGAYFGPELMKMLGKTPTTQGA